jgi:SIR2-like domain
MASNLEEKDWGIILSRIRSGNCTPFIGAGASHGVLPLGSEIAQEWAEAYGYPLEDSHNLVRVAQFLAIELGDGLRPKEIILDKFRSSGAPDFTVPNEPHSLLASLPLPVYITTNYDNFLVQALRHHNRDPRREFCRWRQSQWHRPSIFESEPAFQPTVPNPIVFHLHGNDERPDSLVLMEDDYFDFMIQMSRDHGREHGIIPPRIAEAIAGSSLLFIGYAINDWDFRVIFRSLSDYVSHSTGQAHISVQVAPGANPLQIKKAEKYLTRYYGNLNIRMYWGTCRDFSSELRRRWVRFQNER